MKQILVTGHAVPDRVASLPASKQRKSRPQIQFYRVLLDASVRRGDVTDLVPVIDVRSSRREDSVEALDASLSGLGFTSVLVTREGTLQQSTGVQEINVLLDSYITPMRELDGSLELGHRKELVVILKVHHQLLVGERQLLLERSISYRRASLGDRFDLGVAFNVARRQRHVSRLFGYGIRQIGVRISRVLDQLLLLLGDLLRMRYQLVREDRLHLYGESATRCQMTGQLDGVEGLVGLGRLDRRNLELQFTGFHVCSYVTEGLPLRAVQAEEEALDGAILAVVVQDHASGDLGQLGLQIDVPLDISDNQVRVHEVGMH